MITSVFSPPTNRSLCAPTVLKMQLDLVAARARELRRELAHRPLDRARAHHFDLGHSNSFYPGRNAIRPAVSVIVSTGAP